MTTKEFQEKGYITIFASYYKPHLKIFALDLFCALCIALVDLTFPYVSRLSMQTLLPQGAFTTFFTVMAILFGAYALKAVMTFVVAYWGHLMGVRIEADIRRDLFAHMQELSFSFYDKNRTGHLMSRVTSDLFEITELSHHGPEDLFISAVTLIGAFVVLCTVQWKLAVVVFLVIPLFLIFSVAQRKRMMRTSLAVKQKMAGINGELESSISGMRTAKAFANEAAESEKFAQANDQFRGGQAGLLQGYGYLLWRYGVCHGYPARAGDRFRRLPHHDRGDGLSGSYHLFPVYLHLHFPHP